MRIENYIYDEETDNKSGKCPTILWHLFSFRVSVHICVQCSCFTISSTHIQCKPFSMVDGLDTITSYTIIHKVPVQCEFDILAQPKLITEMICVS